MSYAPLSRRWASEHIAALARGETVSFRPRGGSMKGRIEDGQLVTVSPDVEPLAVDDIVLVSLAGFTYVHLVKQISNDNVHAITYYQIGNNRGRVNGWASRKQIHGKVVRVEP